TQITRQLIHLGLEEVSDRLDVRAAVAVFDEKTLIVLVLVGRADDRKLAGLGVKIERAHPGALLEVRSGHELEQFARRQRARFFAAIRLDDSDRKDVESSFLQEILGQNDLRFVAFGSVKSGYNPLDGAVAAAVAIEAVQCLGNVLQERLDAETGR